MVCCASRCARPLPVCRLDRRMGDHAPRHPRTAWRGEETLNRGAHHLNRSKGSARRFGANNLHPTTRFGHRGRVARGPAFRIPLPRLCGTLVCAHIAPSPLAQVARPHREDWCAHRYPSDSSPPHPTHPARCSGDRPICQKRPYRSPLSPRVRRPAQAASPLFAPEARVAALRRFVELYAPVALLYVCPIRR